MATQRIMYVALADLVQRELGVWEARGGITGNPKFPRLLAEKQAVNRELWECTYAVRDTGLILAFEKPEDVVRRAEDNGSMNGQMYMRLVCHGHNAGRPSGTRLGGQVWQNYGSRVDKIR